MTYDVWSTYGSVTYESVTYGSLFREKTDSERGLSYVFKRLNLETFKKDKTQSASLHN